MNSRRRRRRIRRTARFNPKAFRAVLIFGRFALLLAVIAVVVSFEMVDVLDEPSGGIVVAGTNLPNVSVSAPTR
jgi:hypothetical protein